MIIRKMITLIILELLIVPVYSAEKIIGIADIMNSIADWDKETGMCPVKPVTHRYIQASLDEHGEKKGFIIDFNSLPEMLPFDYCYGYARVFKESGGQVMIKHGETYGWIKSKYYSRYLTYPELLKGNEAKNNSVKTIYQLNGNNFTVDPFVLKENYSFKYIGYINQNGEIWIHVNIYDTSYCNGQQKLLKEGWVKGYINDQPSLWVFPRGC